MRIWPLSDLHLETSPGWDLPPSSERPAFDVLVVVGDVIPRGERAVRWLLERVSDKPVLFVMGNHESYGEDVDRTLDKAREAALGTNLHVIENDFFEIGGVEFAGGTLWTNYALYGAHTVADAMRVALHNMNDFRRIRTNGYSRRFRPHDALARHERTVAFLRSRKALAPDMQRVIVTHHSPDRMAAGRDVDLLAASYASNLEGLISELGASLWISGHIHESNDRLVGRTRLISNPKGYGAARGTWENRHFNARLVVGL
jgi:Icc-related predicted phosphoesterase